MWPRDLDLCLLTLTYCDTLCVQVDAIREKIGYPDFILNNTALEMEYAEVLCCTLWILNINCVFYGLTNNIKCFICAKIIFLGSHFLKTIDDPFWVFFWTKMSMYFWTRQWIVTFSVVNKSCALHHPLSCKSYFVTDRSYFYKKMESAAS